MGKELRSLIIFADLEDRIINALETSSASEAARIATALAKEMMGRARAEQDHLRRVKVRQRVFEVTRSDEEWLQRAAAYTDNGQPIPQNASKQIYGFLSPLTTDEAFEVMRRVARWAVFELRSEARQ